jgi:hypothetical protein
VQAASAGPIYVIDTSSWIEIEGHPAQNQILSALAALIEVGRVKSVPEAEAEIKKCSNLNAWLKPHRKSVFDAPTNDPAYLLKAGEVTRKFPAMAGARGKKNKADPWIIARAIHLAHSPPATVIAEETAAKRASRKIPTACAALGVPCDNLMAMLKKEFSNEPW